VELSAQADLKASIVITTSSLVLTLALSRSVDEDYRTQLAVLVVGVLGSLMFAIVAVFPKFRAVARGHTPQALNPFFFGHAAQLSEQAYVERMVELIRNDEAIYRALLVDIHAQSTNLLSAKYRWLRMSYAMLLVGFVGAAITHLVRVIGAS
jgi:hypothetical protein